VKLKAHKIYVFTLRNGKKRFAYGDDPEHARKIMAYRMTPVEMLELSDDPPEVIRQAEMQRHVKDLG
jgi:hypothetical protein